MRDDSMGTRLFLLGMALVLVATILAVWRVDGKVDQLMEHHGIEQEVEDV